VGSEGHRASIPARRRPEVSYCRRPARKALTLTTCVGSLTSTLSLRRKRVGHVKTHAPKTAFTATPKTNSCTALTRQNTTRINGSNLTGIHTGHEPPLI
jgi:hypothetical protein